MKNRRLFLIVLFFGLLFLFGDTADAAHEYLCEVSYYEGSVCGATPGPQKVPECNADNTARCEAGNWGPGLIWKNRSINNCVVDAGCGHSPIPPPTNLSPADGDTVANTGGTYTFTWDAPSPLLGVTDFAYRLRTVGGPVQYTGDVSVFDTSFDVTGFPLILDGSYEWSVRSVKFPCCLSVSPWVGWKRFSLVTGGAAPSIGSFEHWGPTTGGNQPTYLDTEVINFNASLITDVDGDLDKCEVFINGSAIPAATRAITNTSSTCSVSDGPYAVGSSISYDFVVTDDAGNESTPRSGSFTVAAAGNASPTVSTTGPANGSSFNQGDNINFTGTANDAEDGNITANISWASSIDGNIGAGGNLNTSTLSAGNHTITASVIDSTGASGSDSVAITVTAPGCTCPSIWIDDICGGGTCGGTQMHQTRTCNPAACGSESQCIASGACGGGPVDCVVDGNANTTCEPGACPGGTTSTSSCVCTGGDVACIAGGGPPPPATLVAIPGFSFADILAILSNIGDWLFVFAMVLAPIMIVIGAALFMTGASNPSQLLTAKKIFLGTAIGFVLILFAKVVFNVLSSIIGA